MREIFDELVNLVIVEDVVKGWHLLPTVPDLMLDLIFLQPLAHCRQRGTTNCSNAIGAMAVLTSLLLEQLSPFSTIATRSSRTRA